MKILLVSEPGLDGVFRYVEALAHFLIAHGTEVHLAYSDHRSGEALPRLVDYVRQHDGATLNLHVGNRPALASDWHALRALHDFVVRVRPDVIHSHSSKAGVLARAQPLLGTRLPQVYHPHAYAGMRPQSPLGRLLYDGIEAVLGRAGYTINCSEDEYRYARRRLRLPSTRCQPIPNGVDTRQFAPAAPADKAALRHKFGLPAKTPVLGALGRTCVQKDPVTLYRAFARALAANPELVLLHIGTGELDHELHRFVRSQGLQNRIVRRTYLARPLEFYQAVDGFILPSVYEGLALAALEAIACDLPLILSDAPGNRNLMKLPFNQLWTAPVGDVGGFAHAIIDWAASRYRWSSAPRSNHRRIARETFDHQVGFIRVLGLYQELIARSSLKTVRRRRPRQHSVLKKT
jgi:glycosyltransferase involved in cell wall biosynthesis